MNPFEPSNYARRILLVVSGMSPQILTETLYALTQNRTPAFYPTEVHVLTTRTGANNARLTLLHDKAHFLRLCEEYKLDATIFGEERIHCIQRADGHLLDDIRTVQENEIAADYITDFIREMTAGEDTALHVSMAGGRKTMGYYAGYALSLYGREQDRLSHVLVSDGFEGHRDFYYPTRQSFPIYQDKRVLDAKDACVTLAEIPFVRLRQDIPESLLKGRASFNETIAIAQRSQQPQRVWLDCENLDFRIGDVSLVDDGLGTKSLTFFLWLMERQLSGQPLIGGQDFLDDGKALGKEFQAFCQALEKHDDKTPGKSKFPKLSQIIEAQNRGMVREDFDSRRSILNSALRELLGKTLGNRFALQNFGKRGEPRYGFSIEPEQIEWRPLPSRA